MSDSPYTLNDSDTKPTTTHLKVIIAVLGFLFLGAGVGNVVLGVSYYDVKDQWSYNYCPVVADCINTPQDYHSFMDHDSGYDGYYGPACVANNMMGRLISISHSSLASFYPYDPKTWNPTTIANYGRIAFAITPDMLSRLLPMGRYSATRITEELGYPVGYTCGSAAKNFTDCEYRLLVWTAPCPSDGFAIVPGFWGNLETFYRNFVYGDKTPNLTSALLTIHQAEGLLQNYTGCDPNILITSPTNTTIQQLAGCSQAFMKAMAQFSGSKCTCPVSQCTHYNSTDNCTAENTFLSLSNPTAEQLRAFLMTFEAFNPYFTGYGYTAMANYYDPLAGECWYPNSAIADMQGNMEIIKLYNGTACGTNCT